MKIYCLIIFSLVSQFVLIQSAYTYFKTVKKLNYNSCKCKEILDKKRRSEERKKRSLQRNGNSKENLNANFTETTSGTKDNSNHDNKSEEKLFKQPSRRGNRKKRELNYLKVDDVDIDFKDGNIPTIKFKIEVNLSSLVDYKPEIERVENSCSVGNQVNVIGGKYKGETAKVFSVAPKTVRLIISGKSGPTGNIPFRNLACDPKPDQGKSC